MWGRVDFAVSDERIELGVRLADVVLTEHASIELFALGLRGEPKVVPHPDCIGSTVAGGFE
ncbi:hypothetical protein BEL07_25575 [Mycolicibacterium grossiae]|uniref:Uncharacterized protein n=1 Tax=Mycolicibacterium grossiae TaxID=1552759 RepID=A0A1E8PZ74_9MYCO|nr:hypothetical protein BEL07_25575 [Mycolicibacterium grossiae]